MNIGIIGCGAIGSTLAKAAEDMEEVSEIYLFDKSHVCSRVLEDKLSKVISILTFEELVAKSDFIIEAASQEAVSLFCKKILEKGKDLMIMSVGALVDDDLREDLKTTAKKHDCKIFLPTGALSGVDGLASAAVFGIEEVILTTRKPPSAFSDVEFIKKEGIDLENLSSPKILFEGTAKEAVKLFPKNVNVAATVSLAGMGFERTKVKIIADPSTEQNHHQITVKGEFGSMNSEVDNLPFERNPKTSKIAAASAIAAMKKIVSTYWVGV
ncbi:MAG: aspartate dehydrogenase [Thermoplasmata archaeon]|nr:MAG: aspartate dehydrogenase [Thermoplasmata archaeon]